MNRMSKKLLLSKKLFTLLLLACFAGFIPTFANGNKHYLAFASDRHQNLSQLDSITPVVNTAMQCWNNLPVEYVSLIGDMVGKTGGDAPAYDVSTVWEEVNAVFPSLTVEQFSIIWADHDAGYADTLGLGVMKCSSASETDYGTSALIYTSPDKSYYIYAVNYYEMLTYGTATTDAFKEWVDTIDKNALLIVLCHAPMHYKRKDNLNGANWCDALNYAATGSVDGTQVMRNVVFLHGHNHTTEATEYYYKPGDKVAMQGQSESENKTIHFTYITAGYLKKPRNTNTLNATLLTMDDDEISFTKSKSGETSLLGTVPRVSAEGGTVTLKCATPELVYAGRKVSCSCATPDVTFSYRISLLGAEGVSADGKINIDPAFKVEVTAKREGYIDSDVAAIDFTLEEVGDVNGDGKINIADVTALVDIILGK